jgi:phosphoglycerate dehydrogenase-like enzyme
MTRLLTPAGESLMAEPANDLSPIRTTRVLFALTETELGIFFNGELPSPDPDHIQVFRYPEGHEDWPSVLEDVQPDILVSCWKTPALPEAWLQRLDCPLRYVCHLTGSVRHVVPRSFLEDGGLVTNWGGIAAPQVAEHALLLALAALRNLPTWRRWDKTQIPATQTLFEKSVGIHGFGKVARCLVDLLRPFGVRARAYSDGVPASLMQSHGVTPAASLQELFSQSEVLFDCEALNELTELSVSDALLAALPDNAVFVNVGRGRIVDEDALAREAASGRITVAIDVVTHEPLPPDSPLATLPRVIYSPHIAGPTGDQFPHCGKLALENIRHYINHAPLDARVTLDIYDRAT